MGAETWDDYHGNVPVLGKLQQLLDSGRAIAFVGAGASAGLYPIWQELVRDIIDDVAENRLAQRTAMDFWLRMSERSPARAFERIKNAVGEPNYYSFLSRTFCQLPQPAFTAIHEAMMRLPFLGYVTTNFDDGLSAARQALWPGCRSEGDCTWADDHGLMEWRTGNVFENCERPILFAHGRREGNRLRDLVLSADEYRAVYHSDSYRRMFCQLFHGYRLVFVGFGFSDPWFDFIIDEAIAESGAEEEPYNHVAFVGLSVYDAAFPPDMRLTFQEQYHCEVVYYPVRVQREGPHLIEDHSALLGYLNRFLPEPVQKQKVPWPARAKVLHGRDHMSLPLHVAESRYLQLLLSEFSLGRERGKRGATLSVKFTDETDAIWSEAAKSYLRDSTRDFEEQSKKYQAELDAFLLDNEGDAYEFHDDEFLFRYVSGGTLPIIVIDSEDYYCLFYRTRSPIGWNIANGGSDSFEELRNPEIVIARELLEELILIDDEHDFLLPVEPEIVRPELRLVRERWNQILAPLGSHPFDKPQEQIRGSVESIKGPDCLSITYEGEDSHVLTGVFVNINALDFGIEVDRILRIDMDRDLRGELRILDGEPKGTDELLNRPVGLFKVRELNEALAEGRTAFIPDFFFHSAKKRSGSSFKNYVQPPLNALLRSVEDRQPYEDEEHKFGLCPVTERIVRRYGQSLQAAGQRAK